MPYVVCIYISGLVRANRCDGPQRWGFKLVRRGLWYRLYFTSVDVIGFGVLDSQWSTPEALKYDSDYTTHFDSMQYTTTKRSPSRMFF